LQKGILEVVENKGANLRLKGALVRLIEVEERSGRGLVEDKHNLVYHIFTACQMISCKYKHFEWIAGNPMLWGGLELMKLAPTPKPASQDPGSNTRTWATLLANSDL
jgi:hypothetical protein